MEELRDRVGGLAGETGLELGDHLVVPEEGDQLPLHGLALRHRQVCKQSFESNFNRFSCSGLVPWCLTNSSSLAFCFSLMQYLMLLLCALTSPWTLTNKLTMCMCSVNVLSVAKL